jgi:hypothetical protein
MNKRFIVTVWHGEGGSIAYVMDTMTEDCAYYTSTIRNGIGWRDEAQRECDLLNTAERATT